MKTGTTGLTTLICAALVSYTPRMSAADEASARVRPNSMSSAATSDEVQHLRLQLAEQQRQIDELRRALLEQRRVIDGLTGGGSKPPAMSSPVPTSLGELASRTPVIPAAHAAIPSPAGPVPQSSSDDQPSPLQLRVGSTTITPVGFMDFTLISRSTNPGTGIGTNFGSIPLKTAIAGNLSETRLSAQNSRIGLRADANVRNAHVLGYLEADFLGFVPQNAAVSNNADTLRLRLFWASLRTGKFEFLGGQSWTMLTPNRKGISALPSDLFYTQVIDVNYQAGLTWARDPGFRVLYHPSQTATLGVSFENPEQYIGGSAGGGIITLPAALATPYATQLDNGTTTLSTPNLHPDIIAKVALDPKLPNGRGFHLEFAGVQRTFKVYNPLSDRKFTSLGGAGAVNLNIELFKDFRFITNNYYGTGGGRYIFGQAPDVIVRPDGSLSPIHSGSTVTGFEWVVKNTLIYAYYGGIYIRRNLSVDLTTGKPVLVGYGYSGSPGGQNRTIHEASFGFNQTFWKDPRWGALSLMGQYSYLQRNPWSVATGQPDNAHLHMAFLNLRYTLPGAPPAIEH